MSYQLKAESWQVFIDVTCRWVKNFVNEEQEPGGYTMGWDTNGGTSGVYFIKLTLVDSTKS